MKKSVADGEVTNQSARVTEDSCNLPAIIVPVRHLSAGNTYPSLRRSDCVFQNLEVCFLSRSPKQTVSLRERPRDYRITVLTGDSRRVVSLGRLR
jgi:hypothetical protein